MGWGLEKIIMHVHVLVVNLLIFFLKEVYMHIKILSFMAKVSLAQGLVLGNSCGQLC